VPLIAPSEISLERLTFARSLRACALIQFAWMVVGDGCPGCPTCSNVDPPDASFDWAGLFGSIIMWVSHFTVHWLASVPPLLSLLLLFFSYYFFE
jgi:hypothetical protein